jgi:hypothetical protein
MAQQTRRPIWFLVGLLAIGFAGGLTAGLNWTSIRADVGDLTARLFERSVTKALPGSPHNVVTVTDQNDGGFDHLLGPTPAIRTANFDKLRFASSVDLTLLIDPRGVVISAIPRDGPQQFYATAVKLAMNQQFIPFRRNGVPVIAKLDDFFIGVYPPERRPNYRMPFPAVKDWNSVLIALVRSGCFGQCPIYSLAIHGDGTVEYEGKAYVAIVGKHKAKISPAVVQQLVETFRRADYFWLFDEYRYSVTDNPSTVTSISFDGRSKTVFDYVGLEEGMPTAVRDLEKEIDRRIDAERWLKGDGETAASLVAEGWNFKDESCNAQSILPGVAHYGTRQAVRDLILAGAPVNGQCRDERRFRFGGTTGTAVEQAASRGDYDLTMDIVHAGAWRDQDAMEAALFAGAAAGDERIVEDVAFFTKGKPSIASLGSAMVAGAGSCKPAVVSKLLELGANAKSDYGKNAVLGALGGSGITDGPGCAQTLDILLKAGAPVNGRDNFGETALIKNCCSPEIAKILIAHGADVNARDNQGRTALMNSWHKDVSIVLLQAGADPYLKDDEGHSALDALAGDKNPPVLESRLVIQEWMAKHPKSAIVDKH